MDSGQLLDAYKKANDARFQSFNKFNQVIEDLRVIGMSEKDIRKTLRQAGVSGVNKLLRGEYEPLKISSTVMREMRRNGTLDLLPRDEIRQIRLEQRDRPFGKVVPEPEVQDTSTSTPAPTSSRYQLQDVTPTSSRYQLQDVTPTQQPLSQTGNATSSILNPDPTTRALAEELERRRG